MKLKRKIKHLLLLFAGFFFTTVSLVGCANLPPPRQSQTSQWEVPDDMTFIVTPEDQSKSPSSMSISTIRYVIDSRWSPESVVVLKNSSLPEKSKYSALLLRAFLGLNSGCKNMKLLNIRMATESEKTAQGHDPTAPAQPEIWDVDECGTQKAFHVDDAGVPIEMNVLSKLGASSALIH